MKLVFYCNDQIIVMVTMIIVFKYGAKLNPNSALEKYCHSLSGFVSLRFNPFLASLQLVPPHFQQVCNLFNDSLCLDEVLPHICQIVI